MLGGDATHSILVKGLDYSLLAARKAELAQTGEEIADEELEALIQQAKPTKAITEVAQTEKKEEVKKEALGKGVSVAPRWATSIEVRLIGLV
jgi:hypothetical protein